MRHVTNSEVYCLAACEMEWWLSYLFNASTGRGDGTGIETVKPYEPFWVGDGFHVGLAFLYSQEWDADGAVEAAMGAMDQPENVWTDPESAERAEFLRRMVEGMIRGYAVKWLSDLDKWDVDWCEKSFNNVPIVERRDDGQVTTLTDYRYAGKVDLRATRRVGKHKGKVFAWDHKSTAQFSDRDLEALKIADQPTRYFHALECGGEPVDGMIWNMVRKPTIRQRKKETLQEYVDRLQRDYVERDPQSFYYRRAVVWVSQDRVRQSIAHLAAATRRIADLESGRRDPIRKTSNCTLFGTCRFMPICVEGRFTKTIAKGFRQKARKHEELR